MGEGDEPQDKADSLTAAAGWCAPSEVLYEKSLSYGDWALPLGPVPRGGFKWREPTVFEVAAAEQARAWAARMAARRDAAIDAACVVALAERWDVHVYEPQQPEPYVGIEFTPAKRSVPTVHYHQTDWLDWDDD